MRRRRGGDRGGPGFSERDRRDAPEAEDTAVTHLLAGAELPPDAPAGLRPVAEVLAALRAAPTGGELSGEAEALARFREIVTRPARRSFRRRAALVASRFSTRVAAAAAVAALGLGGVATAAYAGSLPAPLQRFAHETVGAPAPRGGRPALPGPRTSASSPVPATTGPAAYGLCTAYASAKAEGAAERPADFRRLAAAAGGPGKVASYCERVLRTGAGQPRAHHAAPSAARNPRSSRTPAPGSPRAPSPGSSHSPNPRPSHEPSPRPSHLP